MAAKRPANRLARQKLLVRIVPLIYRQGDCPVIGSLATQYHHLKSTQTVGLASLLVKR